MEVTLRASMSALLLLRFSVGRAALVLLPQMSSQVGMASELLVAVSARVDGPARVVSHVNTQLVEVEERLVALCTGVLFLLVLLGHVQPAYNTSLVRIFESNSSYFSIRFDSKRAQLFEIFEYLSSPISYLFNRMTLIFYLSNHA